MRKNLVLHTMKRENGRATEAPPSREELFTRLHAVVRNAVDLPPGKTFRSNPRLPVSHLTTRKARKARDISRLHAIRRAVKISGPVKALARVPKRLLFLTSLLLALLLAPTQTSHFAVAADSAVAGNKKTQVFHNQKCRFYPQAKIGLEDRQRAISKGFRPCGHCGG